MTSGTRCGNRPENGWWKKERRSDARLRGWTRSKREVLQHLPPTRIRKGRFMEQRKITLRLEIMTPEAAHAIVTHELYERQRPLDQSVVQEYTLAMRNGEFRQGTILSFCVYRGTRSLINGQHTLHALIRAGVRLELGVEEIQVESLEERAV